MELTDLKVAITTSMPTILHIYTYVHGEYISGTHMSERTY